MTTTPLALTIACPMCGAPIGEPCRAPMGRGVHLSRLMRASDAMRASRVNSD